MSGPSQPKVEGEEWSDERIKAFLDLQPRDETSQDYHVLKEAYQYMLPEFFERFVPFFVEAGRDIDSKNQEGESLLVRIQGFAKSGPYCDVLKAHGAKA
jgi:hypothetical protein